MTKEIYFAGGCFWGVQHFFDGVDGVVSSLCGYANGNGENPSYEEVYTDETGFAETVKVLYDPSRISLATLAEYFFCIIDPLSLNRQGPDEGTRYRTGVYYTDEAEREILAPIFESVSRKNGAPLAVELRPLRNFYPAEERHQAYLVKNTGGYCHLSPRVFTYLRLYQDIKNILGNEADIIARMAETASLISERMPFLWTGFYRVEGNELVLGPFAGPAACLRIPFGKGVCGSAWKENRTIVVPDVEKFPGHIACSSLSRSEIVVPLRAGGKVFAVLDIDSENPDAFDFQTDALWLEKIASCCAFS